MIPVVQIILAEARGLSEELDAQLPGGGVLQILMGDEFSIRDNAADANPLLIYHPHIEALTWRTGPENSDRHPLRFEAFSTFDDSDSAWPAEFDDDPEIHSLTERIEPFHQMLGVPFFIQTETEGYAKAQALLIAIDSDPEMEWQFGDAGMLYFSADAAAWARGELANVRYEFQCL